MQTDPIADLLTRIRNACTVSHPSVEIPASRLKIEIVKLLLQHGAKVTNDRWGHSPINEINDKTGENYENIKQLLTPFLS